MKIFWSVFLAIIAAVAVIGGAHGVIESRHQRRVAAGVRFAEKLRASNAEVDLLCTLHPDSGICGADREKAKMLNALPASLEACRDNAINADGENVLDALACKNAAALSKHLAESDAQKARTAPAAAPPTALERAQAKCRDGSRSACEDVLRLLKDGSNGATP